VDGRLGRAIAAAVGPTVVGWRRPDLDLDRPETVTALVERDRPSLVIHAAAMTAVDACARDPETALRRNGHVVAALAAACLATRTGLVMISTNEVFHGDRDDGRGYGEDDERRPRNAYGVSKLAGEVSAQEAFGDDSGLWIVRTAWLYGPPGNDFPDKIVAAADRLPADEALPVVSDEYGSPTSVTDLAPAILRLVERSSGGVFHLVNGGHTTRLGWAEQVLLTRRPGRPVRPISRTGFSRESDPPPWGVLAVARAATVGVTMRPWQEALADHLREGFGDPDPGRR
jgi:dTDP-4-dehydrorhamnose reductase